MTSDPDIFRAAKLLIEQHGAQGAVVAATRADELIKERDYAGGVIWRRIAEAIEELTRGRREDEPLN